MAIRHIPEPPADFKPSLLERMGIVPDRPLTPADLAGLPLPERLWE